MWLIFHRGPVKCSRVLLQNPMPSSVAYNTAMINRLRPRQHDRHFSEDIFKCIFLNENVWILLKISLKFVPKVRISNIPTLVQIMAWPRQGDKPLSEPMMENLLTRNCVSRPQWVKVKYSRPDFELTKDTPYLIITGSVLWVRIIQFWIRKIYYYQTSKYFLLSNFL